MPVVTHPFDVHYFLGGDKVGGYAGPGYSDFPCHWTTFRKIMEHKPESVLELGCARGYVLRRLEDAGVRVKGLEISEHCRLTRAVEDVVTWDITVAPWPVADGAFDLCISVAVLEHIPEDKLQVVFSEMARTCKRGLHGIDLHDTDHFDKTHCSIHEESWWAERLPKGHVGVDKESLEAGEVLIPYSPGVKLNLGCFTTMFPGWRNLDVLDLSDWARAHGYSFTRWDLRFGLPFDDAVVDLIFACHVLEYLNYDDGARLLKESYRVLRPGGVLRVLVPNTQVLVQRYFSGTLSYFDEMSPTCAARPTQVQKLWELLCEGGHKAIYDEETLLVAMRQAGFLSFFLAPFRTSMSPVMQAETTDLYPDLSLIVEAVKE